MWIRIGNDPFGKPFMKAVSLGAKYGCAYAGYAREVPEDFFEEIGVPNFEKFFDIVDDDDVTDEEREAQKHNTSRNLSLKAQAKARNDERIRRRRARKLAEMVQEIELTEDVPDSDDD